MTIIELIGSITRGGEMNTCIMELEQRFFFWKQKVKIVEEGVEVSHPKSEKVNTYSFDHLERKWFIRIKRDQKFMIASVLVLFTLLISVSLSAMGLFSASPFSWAGLGLIGLISFLVYWYMPMREYCILLDDEKVLPLIKDKPNEASFEAFVEAIFVARKSYIRQNYFFIDEKAPYEEEMWKLKWLNREQIITDHEFVMAAQQVKP